MSDVEFARRWMKKGRPAQRHFIAEPPKPGDDRPRNAWGILIGFGQAYREYYERRDAMTDHSQQHYYEAVTRDESIWSFKVYHYDVTGNKEVIVHESGYDFDTKEEAQDAAVDWCDENSINAEMA